MAQMHYHKETGMEARDRTSIGVKLAKGPVKSRLHGGALDECEFRIPAGASNHPVEALLILEDDIRVTAFSPHMHLRGKDFRTWAELPDGTKLDLLNIPNYDFNWQTNYELLEPISLPAKTKIARDRPF